MVRSVDTLDTLLDRIDAGARWSGRLQDVQLTDLGAGTLGSSSGTSEACSTTFRPTASRPT